MRLVGIVKDQDHSSEFDNGCDLTVRVLPDGPVIKITQNLAKARMPAALTPVQAPAQLQPSRVGHWITPICSSSTKSALKRQPAGGFAT
jgi:hypothetical protein